MQEDMHDVKIILPPPEPTVINVNFTLDHGRVTVILTESRRRILEKRDKLVIDGMTYSAAKCDSGEATEAFLRKYGREHMDRYFTGRKKIAYTLTPVADNVHRELHPDQYSARIQLDTVQAHLRTVASDYLRKFMADGVSILEIGCSNGYEISRARNGFSGTSCVCADVSPEALKFARENSPRGIYERFVEVSGNWNETIGTFDIIYSTFGATDASSFDKIASFARNNLNRNGVFICTALNRFAAWDLVLSIITGKRGYARDRLSGIISARHSRYPIPVLARSVNEISASVILHPRAFRGISILFPPYNYRRINGVLARIPFIRKLDETLSGIFPVSMMCEYLLFAMSPGTA
ncbi:MAG: methyltransferase domain-containing protein [Candidatus Thermoplasmatota archaeon]|nr:methyltransferase domain-containing protein [Candidatus Thermoplasmatota archaeon]